MRDIDLNGDVGEGMPNDEALMSCISSANIACGYHAGDENTMQRTVELAIHHRVAIGAHPSFPDREFFGRQNQVHSPKDIFDMVSHQLEILSVITKRNGTILCHVKPHGALYNMAFVDKTMAEAIASAVHSVDPALLLYGLSGSQLILAGKMAGLKTVNEVFADRSYQVNGSLTPRNQPNALINNPSEVVRQVLQMVEHGTVTTLGGTDIHIVADSVCLHGDGPNALQHSVEIRAAFARHGIRIIAPANTGKNLS